METKYQVWKISEQYGSSLIYTADTRKEVETEVQGREESLLDGEWFSIEETTEF